METITIKDVARICGVGVSTVSRAINNHPDINDVTKEKILKVIRENNYIPNNSARNLKLTNSKSIVVLIKGIGNPFFRSMITTFEREIFRHKHSFILQRVETNQPEIDVALELEKEKKPAGIVFLGGDFNYPMDKFSKLKVPFVLSTVRLKEDLGIAYSSVSVDDFQESYKMVDYLCKLGHRRIAILCATKEDTSIGLPRYEGYLKALEDHNIPFDPALVCPMLPHLEGYSMVNGYAVTTQLLNSGTDFTAIYGISDSTAIGACKALLDAGRKVPEDCSVAGFDGMDISAYVNPSLTTIRQPVTEMAEATIRILFDVIYERNVPQLRVFPGELVVGDSTRKI